MKKYLFLITVLFIAGCAAYKMGPITQAKPINKKPEESKVVSTKKEAAVVPVITEAEKKRRDSAANAFLYRFISPYISDLKESQQKATENLQRIFKIQSMQADSLNKQNELFKLGLNSAIYKLDSQTREGFKKDWKIDSLRNEQRKFYSEQQKITQFVDALIEIYKKFSKWAFTIMIIYFVTLWVLQIITLITSKKSKAVT